HGSDAPWRRCREIGARCRTRPGNLPTSESPRNWKCRGCGNGANRADCSYRPPETQRGALPQGFPADPHPPRRRRMNAKAGMVSRPRPRFLWLWIMLGVAALIGGAALAVRAYVTPERARAFALRALSASLRREVKFARADLTYWPPVSVSVDGLLVSDPQG